MELRIADCGLKSRAVFQSAICNLQSMAERAMSTPTQPVNFDQYPPYLQGVDDLGDNPLGADSPRLPDPTDNPADIYRSEFAWRQAVVALLTEIRDLLADTED
jgi:hypothetical protein